MQRTAVIGMGHIGHRHARAYTECDKAQLVAVCDRVPELAREAGEKFGVPYFTSAQEMLDNIKPDIVSITTGGYEYSSDHYEPTIQALSALLQHGAVDWQIHASRLGLLPHQGSQPPQREHNAVFLRSDKGGFDLCDEGSGTRHILHAVDGYAF